MNRQDRDRGAEMRLMERTRKLIPETGYEGYRKEVLSCYCDSRSLYLSMLRQHLQFPTNNKWSDNFDERPHGRGIFMGKFNLALDCISIQRIRDRRIRTVGYSSRCCLLAGIAERSIVFARRRHCAPATNTWFFGHTRVCLANSSSFGALHGAEMVKFRDDRLSGRFDGFWATVCKTVRPVLSDRCLSVCPVCNGGALWPNGWIDQDETWHAGTPRPGHIVLNGDRAPLPQRGTAPIFGPYMLWPNG